MELGPGGKRELALALFLWKEFKCQGVKFEEKIAFAQQMMELAEHLKVTQELEELSHKMIYPVTITIG